MRTSRRPLARLLARLALLLCGVALLNAALCFALVPYGSSTKVVWDEWEKAADERIDTVFVGPSYAQAAFDPNSFDAVAGTSSFNLGTPAQMLPDATELVRRAIEEHGVKRVFLGLAYNSFVAKPFVNSASTFALAQSEEGSPADAAGAWGKIVLNERFFGKSYSISGLFPWTYSHVALSPSAIRQNIALKLSGKSPLEAADELGRGPDGLVWKYEGKGYYHTDGIMLAEATGVWPVEPEYRKIRTQNLDELASLLDLCSANGVRAYIVLTPEPDVTVLSYGADYASGMAQAKAFVEAHGATFIDANMAKGNPVGLAYTDFNDTEHLNSGGAGRFSAYLAGLVGRIESGEDVSDEFYGYDDWDSYARSIDHIGSACLTVKVYDGHVSLKAQAIAGADVKVDYEFQVLDEATGEWASLGAPSAEDSLDVPTTGHGIATYLVRATLRGTDGEGLRYDDVTVSY